MAVRGLWQSMWSRRDGCREHTHLPRRLRARIELIVDRPMPPEAASAAALEARVRELRSDIA